MIDKRDLEIILSAKADWEKLRNKFILVTGASGRLGIYITQALIEANRRWDMNINILLLARSEKKLKKEFGPLLNSSMIHILLQDITENINTDLPVDFIFHTAGLASPSDFTIRPVETLWGHVQGTKNVLDLAVRKKSEKVLYVSTVEIYGKWEKEDSIKEEDMGPLSNNNYRSCYPEAKRLCETMLASYQYQYNLDYVAIRMSHTLGPGIALDDGRAFAEFLNAVLCDEDIVLQSDGSAVRTYTYTADAVGAMFLALLNGTEHYYNVANTDNQISIRDLAFLITSLSKSGKTQVRYAEKVQNQLAYLPFRLGILDCSRIIDLGWTPQVDVLHVFRWTLESFQ